MSMEAAPEGAVSPRADLVCALVCVAFGAAVVVGSWTMDRLEHLHINKYEIPGLVPGLLGAVIVALGALLALRALRQGALTAAPRQAGGAQDTGRMLLVFAAMVGYAVVLVGHGLPFWLATFLFVTLFILGFDRERQSALGRSLGRQVLLAVACGAATSAVVSFVFESVFYVRLP